MDDFDFSAKRIKSIRIALQLSVAEFTERIGCSKNLVSKWESGESKPMIAPYIYKLLELEYEAGLRKRPLVRKERT